MGLIAGPVYVSASYFVESILKVDDPLDAVAVHGFGGLFGVLLAATFADQDHLAVAYGDMAARTPNSFGVLTLLFSSLLCTTWRGTSSPGCLAFALCVLLRHASRFPTDLKPCTCAGTKAGC